MEAAQLGDLKGTVPDNVLESARGALKAKYQNASPPEVDRALRAVLGRKYVARTVTGTFNPGSTSSAINAIGTAAKYAGRVMLVVVTYQEYHKIVAADDWTRQLGSSSSGILGAIGGGWAGGAVGGSAVGAMGGNPATIAVGAIIGGIGGAYAGYEVGSGAFETLYDVLYE
jgi:hypothetical protein